MLLVFIESIGSLFSFNIFALLYCAVNITCIVYSIAYVEYPTSKLARSKYCRFFLAVFIVLSTLYFIVVVIIVCTVDFEDMGDWDDDIDEYYDAIMAFIAFIYFIPVIHSALILIIRRKRLRIAKRMNAERVQTRSYMVTENPVNPQLQPQPQANRQNYNLGNQYVPPNAAHAENQVVYGDQVIQRPGPLNPTYRNMPQQNIANQPHVVPNQSPSRAYGQAAAPQRLNLAADMSRHPYINPEMDENASLLSDSSSMRQSEAAPYRPRIN